MQKRNLKNSFLKFKTKFHHIFSHGKRRNFEYVNNINFPRLFPKMEESYQENKVVLRELKDCPKCGKPRISFGWCKECETNSMKENFLHWTSENKKLDELIQYTQLDATQTCDYLEWIPFEKFEMVKYIGSGGFSVVYSLFGWKDPDGFGMMMRKNGRELAQ